MATLLCNRPHPNAVNYNTARFVVSTACGLNVNGQKLEMGDLIPTGVLSETALRMEYERPPGRIELLEYALTDPDLREACARRGMDLENAVKSVEVPSLSQEALVQLQKSSRKELLALCKQSGVPLDGSNQQLRERLAALLD